MWITRKEFSCTTDQSKGTFKAFSVNEGFATNPKTNGVKVHLYRVEAIAKASFFLCFLSLLNVNIGWDSLWSHLKAMSLSLHYKRTITFALDLSVWIKSQRILLCNVTGSRTSGSWWWWRHVRDGRWRSRVSRAPPRNSTPAGWRERWATSGSMWMSPEMWVSDSCVRLCGTVAMRSPLTAMAGIWVLATAVWVQLCAVCGMRFTLHS